jgi:phytoene/squalene synthetase
LDCSGEQMVIGAHVVSVFLLTGMMSLNVPSRVHTGGHRSAPIVLQATQQKSPNNANRPGARMGEWLQAHKDLPPDQQLKLLENDPVFKKLPPQRQNALRERLRKFNSLLARLSPDQRKQLRDASQQLQTLPPDRQVAVHKAVRHLRQMTPAERQQIIQSDRFRSTFSAPEQKLISQLAEMNLQESGSAQNPQAK